MAINVLTISGNMGGDLDVRFTPNGKCIGQFSLPVKSGYGDHEKTAWVTCKILGERAEKLAPYLTKGSLVTVTGELQLDEWEKEGQKHSRMAMIVKDMQLPPKSSGQPQQSQQPAQQQGYDNFPDDIPF